MSNKKTMAVPDNVARLQVAYRPLDSLIPYARNSRTHDAGQIAQIAASIREFGWTNPVLIDEAGTIIAGHGRVLAAQKLKHVEVPTITLAGLTDAQRRAYVIADNRLALNAGWDAEMLANELRALSDDGFKVEVLGFEDKEIAALFGNPADDDDAKPPNDDERNLLLVECTDERELQTLFNEMRERGFTCKIMS